MGSSSVRSTGKNLELWNRREKKNGRKFGFSSTSDGLTVFISRFAVDFRPAKTTRKTKKRRRGGEERTSLAAGQK